MHPLQWLLDQPAGRPDAVFADLEVGDVPVLDSVEVRLEPSREDG